MPVTELGKRRGDDQTAGALVVVPKKPRNELAIASGDKNKSIIESVG